MDTKTAVVPPFWRFLKAIWLKNSLNVVYFPNSRRPPPYWAIYIHGNTQLVWLRKNNVIMRLMSWSVPVQRPWLAAMKSYFRP
ncbi:hypothetical protein FM864_14775 [Salmonella enterica subsp. enterica]|nr:hypothetical protein [Salmonella enterica subsp. enterica]EEK9942330.1 hypothetical protein [Salmonella enterica]